MNIDTVKPESVVNRAGWPATSRSRRTRYEKLTDYLIPVVHLIVSGVKHTEAFRQIAEELGVRPQTLNAACTRGPKISTEQFLELIKNGGIRSFLKERFPNKASLIEDLAFE